MGAGGLRSQVHTTAAQRPKRSIAAPWQRALYRLLSAEQQALCQEGVCRWKLQDHVTCVGSGPQHPSASAACSAVLVLPKSVHLNKVAKLLVRYQPTSDQGGIKLQAVHRTANLLQVLQAIGIGLALPGVDIVVNEGVCRQRPGVREDV